MEIASRDRQDQNGEQGSGKSYLRQVVIFFFFLILGTKYERKLKLQQQITPEHGKLYLASIKVMSCRSRIFVVS